MYDNIADDLVCKILCGNSILHEICYVVFSFFTVALDIIICPAPSGREPLARPGTLHFRRKLYRHAKCPIPEDDFPRPMPDSPKGEYPFRLAAARQATFPKGTAFRGGGTVPG